MNEEKKTLTEEELEAVAGGISDAVAIQVNNAIAYCNGKGWTMIKTKYSCPACGSWNVVNYDPGAFYLMRVICTNCGAFRDRSGGDPY